MFIFPASQGKLSAPENPAGKITIGDTITLMYALKIMRLARFIGIDGSALSPDTDLHLVLKVEQSRKSFGFIIRDSTQPNLGITINPSFMAKVLSKNQFSEKMARQGNLNVTLAPVDNGFKIVRVVLD